MPCAQHGTCPQQVETGGGPTYWASSTEGPRRGLWRSCGCGRGGMKDHSWGSSAAVIRITESSFTLWCLHRSTRQPFLKQVLIYFRTLQDFACCSGGEQLTCPRVLMGTMAKSCKKQVQEQGQRFACTARNTRKENMHRNQSIVTFTCKRKIIKDRCWNWCQDAGTARRSWWITPFFDVFSRKICLSCQYHHGSSSESCSWKTQTPSASVAVGLTLSFSFYSRVFDECSRGKARTWSSMRWE